jgi:16S rRNA (cytidine1402-2'-O)-methyltransferase
MTLPARPGRLFLIPTPLGAGSDPRQQLPAATLAVLAQLDCFVVENARTARAFLKAAGIERPLQSLAMNELNEHTPATAVAALLAPLLAGRDLGLLSEAGCPAVADPGAALVASAHDAGIEVVPLVGPSSLLLALMASGLNGQRFAFVGYLPARPDERAARLRELERRSAANDETILWIETPYRNRQALETALAVLAPDTRLSIAAQLTLPAESVRTRPVDARRRRPPEVPREPSVFAMLAAPRRFSAAPAPRPPAPGRAPRRR